MKRLIALFLLLPLTAWADVFPMSPVKTGTVTISCTNSSSATTLPTTILQQSNLEIQNNGSVVVFVETGSSSITAAVATGYPILPGQSKVVTVDPTITSIACISGSGTQTVYVTVGKGN